MKPHLALLLAAALAPAAATQSFSEPLTIDNEFSPFVPGGVKVFLGRSDGEAIVSAHIYLPITRTFSFGGGEVECAVLQETEFEGGQLVEISFNYFAQADDGSVFYFGEVVDEYEDGVIIGHPGSWLVGGATLPTDPEETANAPALFMPADPEVGDSWKPEDLMPIVDETATLVDDDVKVKVFAGKFEGCLQIEETSQLSDVKETKWWAPGVGVIKEKSKGEILKLAASTLVPVEKD